MNNIGKLLVGATLAVGSSAAFAGKGVELLVNSFNVGKQTQLTFDVVGTGASAMDFAIEIPNANKLGLNLDGCVSGLPASHQGQCALVGNKLKVIVYSPTNEVLPAGEIGSISLQGGAKFKAGRINAFGPDGRAVDRSVASDTGTFSKK